ncbi:sugar ABC transporter ATP-binding protein [Bifidobacterium sp. MA2]|uniref:Sugar ABC transporter ATP-binding protein n=1 Tax=Bifidobacterium santillanense TaxID=2809028 RepID=A0ABS5URD3_9BIFI|nr:ATP-binding cassette domain-containing protein [Bifidobacterium santillanense]MBT1173366.1 sugar ABC transporter ATP-binding protein [Bifidobacterium santillanense]
MNGQRVNAGGAGRTGGSSRQPLLRLENICVKFGFVEALKSVNLDIGRQEVVAIVGDNGAGKSTLIKVVAGFLQPGFGHIYLNGEEVVIPSIRAADRLGIASVFQGQEFCDNLNVAANLFLGKEINLGGVRDDESMNSRARSVMKTLSSAIRVGSPISSLSVGQRQTVAIARTLLNDPKLILLDEPTAALSVMQTAEVLSYIKRLRSEGRTVVMVCHDLPDVFAVSDRIVVIRQGRITGVHRTVETSYEEIIAEIAGVATEHEYEEITEDPKYSSMVRQRKRIDRTMSAALEESQAEDDGYWAGNE